MLDVWRVYTRVMAGYQTNSGAVYSLGYHVVWCAKYRRPVLVGPVAERLQELIGQKCDEHGWSVVALEIMPDHVHMFVRADPTASPSYVANQFKGFTSKVLREEFPHLRRRLPTLWSRSYFVSSVGNLSAARVQRYLETQWERPWRKEAGR